MPPHGAGTKLVIYMAQRFRYQSPEDAAKAVEFFCSDLADYVTGPCLPVCGGLVLGPS